MFMKQKQAKKKKVYVTSEQYCLKDTDLLSSFWLFLVICFD